MIRPRPSEYPRPSALFGRFRARQSALLGGLLLLLSSCVGGDLSTGAYAPLGISLVPSFQVDPSTFDAGPIDRIRIRAFDTETFEVVAEVDQTVDPTASEWILDLSVDLAGATSRTVMIEAELFTATVVTWSGRLGPFEAMPSIGSALTAIDIFPGPLDNFDVTSVTIETAPTELFVGEGGVATALTTLIPGSDASPEIFWTSLDPTIVTVTGAGPVAALNAVGEGTATIQAAAGPSYDEIEIVVTPLAQGGEILWVGGDNAGPTDWFIHENWSPVGVPGIDDDVRIPFTSNDPVLTASFQIRDLTVDEGATVDMGGMTHSALGDLFVSGSMINGNVLLSGTDGTALQGQIDEVTLNDDRALSGGLFVDIARISDGTLSVGDNPLVVQSDLVLVSFPGDAALVMDDPGAVVDVAGEVRFQAADHEGLLTAGQMSIGGDLVTSGDRFVATGTHRTTFDGASPQVINLGNAGPTGARFQELDISGVGASLGTDVYVTGDLTLSGDLTVGQGLTLDVGGEIILEAGAVLTVDGTLTAVSGCTDNGADISGLGFNVCLPMPATWIGGDPAGPTSFEVAANWSTGVVPGLGDDVDIPVTANDPVVTGGVDIELQSIFIEDGASLNLGGVSLSVDGDVSVGTAGIVNGFVDVTGPGILDGTLPDLLILGDRLLTGDLLVEGGLVLSDAELDVDTWSLTVEADLSITGVNGGLRMNDPAAFVTVVGDASFLGGQHNDLLTEGTLTLEGNLQGGGLSAAFAATANHTTVFAGSLEQTINLSNPGTVTHRFNHVVFDNVGAGVRFITDVYAMGSVTVTSGSIVDGLDDTLAFAGFLDDPTGGLTIANLEIVGPTAAIPATIDADLGIFADYVMLGDVSVTGNVLLNNNDLTVGAHRLDVSGNLTMSGASAQLGMADAAGIVDVEGSVFFAGAGQTTQLSAGELRVAGDFRASGITSAFGAITDHTVVIDGTADQRIFLETPGVTEHHFNNLTIANTSFQVFLDTDIVVMGAFTVPAGAGVTGPTRTISIAGAFSDGSDGVIAERLVVIGDLSAMDDFIGDVEIQADFTTPSGFFAGGELAIAADFDIGPNSVTAGTDMNVFGSGRLIMTDPAGRMNVQGDAYFDGASHVGVLTAGQLEITSSLFVTGDPNAFSASGTHTTYFPNTGPHFIDFDQPGAGLQAFQNLDIDAIDNPLEFLSDVVVLGDFIVGGDASVDGADDVLSVGGSFQTSGGFATLAELNIIGALTALTGSLDFDVRVSADYTPPGPLTIGGDLRVEGARFDMGGFTHAINGDFEALAGGQLGMTTVGDTLNIIGDTITFAGSANFAGGSHSGLLTEGAIQLTGDLTASGSALAFVSSGNHTVRFVGFLAQGVNFSAPGAFSQRFNNVDIRNFSGSVNLETSAFVMGFFDFDDGDMSRTGPLGTTLELRGTMRLAEATFIGLPVSLESTVSVLSHSMSLVTFTGMDGSDTQLRLRLPGSGQFPGLTGFDTTFDDVLTTGLFVDVGSNNGMPWVFQMGGTPFPSSPPVGSTMTDLVASITWPWP